VLPPPAGVGCSIKGKVREGVEKVDRIHAAQECDARDDDSSNAVE